MAANRKAERPGGQFRAGFGHGLGVGQAVHEAIGARDQQSVLTPVDRSVEAQRFGRADEGEALALNLVLAHVEAALERGACCGGERVFVVCVHCFSSVVASGCVVCWMACGRLLDWPPSAFSRRWRRSVFAMRSAAISWFCSRICAHSVRISAL
ncbi:TPA: hypothetical protein L4I36_002492 [Pseudomonas aeruginosa]|nr:hypothetical protein [Pseudomonas aeruginosa]